MRRLPEQTEQYLQSVFELIEDGRSAAQTEIGRRLHRHAATVSRATRQLQKAGLIRARPAATSA
jgi:Mn-dependent DtxR family transcriptional regulator